MEDEGHQWQKMLYQKISKKGKEKNALNTVFAVSRMLVMSKVLYGLHLVSDTDLSLACPDVLPARPAQSGHPAVSIGCISPALWILDSVNLCGHR